MARKTRQELLEDYSISIDRCRRWRDEENLEVTWRRLVDLYRGKHWPSSTALNRDMIAVNLAFSTINVIAPSVAVNYPKIVVQATSQDNVDRAAFVEAVVNYLWRHHNFRTPFRTAVKDFLIFGHGWVKVGWKFVEQEQSISENERDVLIEEAIAESDLAAMDSPELAGDLLTDEEIMANIPSSLSRIVEDQPFLERVSPFDIFVDPAATHMEDAKWIAQRIVRPLEEAQNDKRFKPSARKRLSADNGYRGDLTDRDYMRSEFVADQVVIWEYYDITNNTLAVYAENGSEFLIDPVNMPYAYGQPFVMLRNYDVPDRFYPIGDLESIESLQLELDKTRSQLMNDRKRYARKYLYHERSFGPEGREALESDEDGRLVPVVDENKPLSEVVVPMPQSPISPEIYNYSTIIENDINTVSGISEYARGAMPEIRRTATEASIVADAQNARSADKLAIVEITISDCARKVIQLMQQFMTGQQMARVSGRGEDLFVEYAREDITGEYDFTVQAGSTQPMNETIRRQQAVSLLNAVAPLVGTVIDPQALAAHVLESGFGIKDPERFMMQQGPPQQGPPGQEGPPGEEMPPEQVPLPPDMGAMPMPAPPGGAFAPTGGVPPELLAQLQGQMGMDLSSL
jgi:hypothetical protein|tara:strand:+ start:3810 stop:5699 length:1890 start_codon:yes stop_codon:yes gene_type:complete